MGLLAIVLAQGDALPVAPGTPNVVPLSSFETLFGNLLTVILEIAGVVLFIMLLKGGFTYLTSSGNPKQVEAGKNTMTYAIMGMLLAASAYFIIQIIEEFTGVDLSTFRVRL